jgi:antirestriction protein
MYQTARQVRRQMGDIQDRMRQQYEQEQQYHQQQQPQSNFSHQQAKPKVDKRDYLDFEEIK